MSIIHDEGEGHQEKVSEDDAFFQINSKSKNSIILSKDEDTDDIDDSDFYHTAMLTMSKQKVANKSKSMLFLNVKIS